MRRLLFLLGLCIMTYIKSASSMCPLCDAAFASDQTTLKHINETCLIANPKLAFKSAQLTEINCKKVAPILSKLQNYIFNVMPKETANLAHQKKTCIAQGILNKVTKNINMPPFCKENANMLLIEIASHKQQQEFKKRAQTILPNE